MKVPQPLPVNLERKGIVTATFISVIAVFGVLILSLFGSISSRGDELNRKEAQAVADGVVESAINLAEAKIWGRMVETDGASFAAHLDALGIVEGSGSPDFRAHLGVPQDMDGHYPLGGGIVTHLSVQRTDTAQGRTLCMDVRARMEDGAAERRVQRTYDGAGRSKEE